MTSAQLEIQAIAVIVAIACAIPGTFLVLRKMSMISDAISHSILPGIVLGFFLVQDLSSPFLVLLAAFTGVLTVVLVEMVYKTGLVKEDTAIGLVFPALFSLGVILISRFADDIHLDTDAVLLGEIAFAPFDRLFFRQTNLGPKSLYVMGAILMVTLTLLFLFFKELKISTFDQELAASLGFSPVIVHYVLMSVTSITTVGAFNAVGAILVVALMIVPAAAAYLLTENLRKMILLAVLFGVFSALAGYWIAHLLDASISGSMASLLGILFIMVLAFAPGKGLLAVMARHGRQKREFSLFTFLLHLQNHANDSSSADERKVGHLTGHFNWKKKQADRIFSQALKNNMITVDNQLVEITPKGGLFIAETLGTAPHSTAI